MQGVRRCSLQRIFSAIFEDKPNCSGQIQLCFIWRATLTIRFRNLGALGDEPIPVALNNRGELVMHRMQVYCRSASTQHAQLFARNKRLQAGGCVRCQQSTRRVGRQAGKQAVDSPIREIRVISGCFQKTGY